MMRIPIIAVALASTAICSPALARDGEWYAGVEGGIMFLDDMDFDIGSVNKAATLRPDSRDFGVKIDGYDFGGVIGHDFGMLRVEGEVSFREADAGVLSSSVRIPALTGVSPDGLTGGAPAGVYRNAGGKVNALSGMVNALVDFGPDGGLQGYVGGGAGLAKVKSNVWIARAGPGFIRDSDSGFAWQLLAGVRAPLSDTIDVGIKYRFFNADGVDYVDTSGRDVNTRWRSHSLLGTLTFNFGGPREVVQVVPPPPPPPPPAPPPAYEPAPPPPPPAPERPMERG